MSKDDPQADDREGQSNTQSQPLDAKQWMAQARGDLKGRVANACDIGRREALNECVIPKM